MRKFFYEKKGKKFGPYTLSELADKKIKNETLVWKQDLDNWVRADSLEELDSVIVKSPPPLPNEKSIKKYEYINYTYAGIGLLLINIVSIAIGGVIETRGLMIVLIIVRVFVAMKVADVAADQGRAVVITGVLGGFFPAITLIVIGLLNKKSL